MCPEYFWGNVMRDGSLITVRELVMSKHEYIQKLKNQLDEWDYEIDRLEARAKDVQQSVNEKVKESVADLKVKSEQLKGRFLEVEHATEEAAADVKDALEMAWNSIKMGVLAVRSEFEENEKK
jgi:vacuolar-type H+-ATPase subunit D/Vma8